MKSITSIIILACAAALTFSSCDSASDAPACPEGAVCYPTLHFSVSEMSVSPESRALYPMNVDEEKYVTTLAIFEFDNEGLHDQSETTYHFIDFIEGTVDGLAGVGKIKPTIFGISETTLDGIAFQNRSNGTICLVANVTKEQVVDLYKGFEEQGHSYGRLTLDYFKTWALPFEYVTTTDQQTSDGTKVDTAYDETSSGHIKTMYMFGYYEGLIDASKPTDIWVDLGRLASRIDITIINETDREICERLGYHFDNVCSSAYVFPSKISMPPTIGAGSTRTLICTGPEGLVNAVTQVPVTFPMQAEHNRYFYAAAHAANEEANATSLHLFWNSKVVGNDTGMDEGGSAVKIPLCNIPPSETAQVPNRYTLSRNTRYHFTIHLKRVPEAPSNPNSGTLSVDYPPSVAEARSVADPERPGHFTVYIP